MSVVEDLSSDATTPTVVWSKPVCTRCSTGRQTRPGRLGADDARPEHAVHLLRTPDQVTRGRSQLQCRDVRCRRQRFGPVHGVSVAPSRRAVALDGAALQTAPGIGLLLLLLLLLIRTFRIRFGYGHGMTPTSVTRAPRADAERNRRRVLDAAARVFAERGASATLNDVARAAGVGVGTVYRKFPDKEAVLDALFNDKINSLVRLADKASTIDGAGAAVRGFLFDLMQMRATDRGLDAILTSPERGARFSEELAEKFVPTVDRLVARAIDAGELRPDFTGQEVCLLGFMIGKVADITRATEPDAWRRYAQLLVDGTRASPGTQPLSPDPLSFTDIAIALGRAG